MKLTYAIAWGILLVLVQATTAVAQEHPQGTISAGGGDGYAIQFIQIANRIAENLLFVDPANRHGIDPRALTNAIYSVQVVSKTDLLELDGRSVDAINYPELQKIAFSQPRWNALALDQRQILVLHEYLGILAMNDASYEISRPIITEKLGLANPCASDQPRFDTDTVAFFLAKGYVIEDEVGDITNTLTGASLYTIRGFSLDAKTSNNSAAYIHALFRVGECNSYTGHYEHRAYSGSTVNSNLCRNE